MDDDIDRVIVYDCVDVVVVAGVVVDMHVIISGVGVGVCGVIVCVTGVGDDDYVSNACVVGGDGDG